MTKRPDEVEKTASEGEGISFDDSAPALEFVCWVVVALCPFLRWVNGAAVTVDQWWIQTFLFSLALLGGILLRLRVWVTRRRIR